MSQNVYPKPSYTSNRWQIFPVIHISLSFEISFHVHPALYPIPTVTFKIWILKPVHDSQWRSDKVSLLPSIQDPFYLDAVKTLFIWMLSALLDSLHGSVSPSMHQFWPDWTARSTTWSPLPRAVSSAWKTHLSAPRPEDSSSPCITHFAWSLTFSLNPCKL